MERDHWKGYGDFKQSSEGVEAYYDFVQSAFFAGIDRCCAGRRLTSAVDLGCGSGDLTRKLTDYACEVVGVDQSPGLIEQARGARSGDGLEFVLGDVLSAEGNGCLGERRFDLVTAAWLHNHLLREEEQVRLAETIERMLEPGPNESGGFVFLIPSAAFRSDLSQDFFERLGWRQPWLKEEGVRSPGVYSFAGSAWAEMCVWQPMWLARLYGSAFEVEFLDVKQLALEHGGMGEAMIEPPFDVMVGRRRH